jgi:hypothetical protein
MKHMYMYTYSGVLLWNFRIALVASATPCLHNSPGRTNLAEVIISLDESCVLLLLVSKVRLSDANLSRMSPMNSLRIPIDFVEMLLLGWTCLRTLWISLLKLNLGFLGLRTFLCTCFGLFVVGPLPVTDFDVLSPSFTMFGFLCRCCLR